MLKSEARVETVRASRYLAQLCKHFAHKVEVTWDAETGDVMFPMGWCHLSASATHLTIECRAEQQEALERVQSIVDDHVVRFGWRERLTVDWSKPTSV
jgi:hypothetical protein